MGKNPAKCVRFPDATSLELVSYPTNSKKDAYHSPITTPHQHPINTGQVLSMATRNLARNHLGCFWNLVNIGINYRITTVPSTGFLAGFLNHQQYGTLWWPVGQGFFFRCVFEGCVCWFTTLGKWTTSKLIMMVSQSHGIHGTGIFAYIYHRNQPVM